MERRNLSVPNAAGPSAQAPAAAAAEAGNSRGSRPAPAAAAEAGNSRGSRPAAASAPAKATASASQTSAQAAQPVDETKLSLADRIKLSRERAKKGSTTDYRSVTQRVKEQFGMKKGGAVKGYASGGSVSSRADGIAQRGKTRGKIC
jgi:hypothetical protein